MEVTDFMNSPGFPHWIDLDEECPDCSSEELTFYFKKTYHEDNHRLAGCPADEISEQYPDELRDYSGPIIQCSSTFGCGSFFRAEFDTKDAMTLVVELQ